ncbi:TetR/AcrR family transcriptional regulator [Blastococcus sp. CT_GayMR20]|uniref:TetR/AcrR family transcriptional regulator n=1 Tax=Blastococcus sp. CT_GayMR20 TaxID=2559609 RepID=UPI001430EAE4|nr:TetR/AcrR family transcriptional regulator [Blastococcus sp. CT_GayMR20]
MSAAADQVLAEQGLGATVGDIAARARVGNATVFRHFPTKADLLSEVAMRWLEDWRADLEQRLASDAAGTALRDLIAELFERLRENRLALDLFRAHEFDRLRQSRPPLDPFQVENLDHRVNESRRAVEALLTEALHRAIRDGLVAADVTYADFTVLVLGTAGRLSDMADAEPSRWRRHADFVWAAIAARRSDLP